MMTNWYEIPGSDSDVVVSTRIRLARNLNGYPFEPKLSETQAKEICDSVKGIYGDGWTYTDFSALSPAERRSLAEKEPLSQNTRSQIFAACDGTDESFAG